MSHFYQRFLSEVDWLIDEGAYNPELQAVNESLFTLGNGYLGSRGIFEELPSHTSQGTFFAGIYEESLSKSAELINAPNPFHLTVYVSTIDKLDISQMEIINHKRILDMRKGLLVRQTVFKNKIHHLYDYQSIRFISYHNLHTAVMQVVLTSLTKASHFLIDSSIDTEVKNYGGKIEYDRRDFQIVTADIIGKDKYLLVRSLDLDKSIAYGERVVVSIENKSEIMEANSFNLELDVNQTVVITKFITFYAIKDHKRDAELKEIVLGKLNKIYLTGFEKLLDEHAKALEKKWQNIEVDIVGDFEVQSSLRLNFYHLLIAAHERVSDVSLGAKLLTGQGYKGHVFWETELLLLPCYTFSNPLLARRLLEYRYNRLGAAIQLAGERGYKGALFPWESADSGSDETPSWHEDLDGTIRIVHTGQQAIHINVAVFYAINFYYIATHDVDFMIEMGLPMMIEMARFWVSRVVHNKKTDTYKIKHVMGPDEFHENINNNTYTNMLVAWSLKQTKNYIEDFIKAFPEKTQEILKKCEFKNIEIETFNTVADRIKISKKDGILSQFDNFSKLKYLRKPHLNVFGLPELPPEYLVIDLYKTQFIKQSDIILLLLLLPSHFDHKVAEANFHFYDQRTLHRSSWSPPISAAIAAQINDLERAYYYFKMALDTDRKNIFLNSYDGVHTPAVGGVWVALIYGFCGIRLLDTMISITPKLPIHWQSVSLKFYYRGFLAKLSMNKKALSIHFEQPSSYELTDAKLLLPIKLKINHKIQEIVPGVHYTFPWGEPDSSFKLVS